MVDLDVIDSNSPDFQFGELNIIRECLIEKIERGSGNPYYMLAVISVFKKVDKLMEQERCE